MTSLIKRTILINNSLMIRFHFLHIGGVWCRSNPGADQAALPIKLKHKDEVEIAARVLYIQVAKRSK